MNFLFIILPFLVGAGFCALFLPVGVNIAKENHLFDKVNERKSHTIPTPRIGGIVFVPVLLLTIFLSVGILLPFLNSSRDSISLGLVKHIAFFMSGMLLIYLTGWVDDFRGIRYNWKFLAQMLVALCIVLGGYYYFHLGGLFGIGVIPRWLGSVLTILITVAIINSYNLVDGIDGLCASLGILTTAFFDYCFIRNGMVMQTIIASSTIGVFFTFLICNLFDKKHKTFMGDTGSLSIGLVISYLALSLYCGNYWHSHVYSFDPLRLTNPFVIIVGALFHPAFDMCRVFVTRLAKHQPPFSPDRLHFHHKLLDLGLTHLQATAVIVLIQLFFICLNWFSSYILGTTTIIVMDIALAILIWQIINFVYRKRTVNATVIHTDRNN